MYVYLPRKVGVRKGGASILIAYFILYTKWWEKNDRENVDDID